MCFNNFLNICAKTLNDSYIFKQMEYKISSKSIKKREKNQSLKKLVASNEKFNETNNTLT